MIQTNRRAALYARFSSDNQRSESIDAQVRAMTEYCRQKKIIIVETYVDEARSATTDKRPSFQRMIADSEKKLFDIVLVHKLDRFARNRYDSAIYKRELKKNGVSLFSVLENLDDSPESIMMEAVLEGMAEYYSQNLARETMKGMKENALQTIHTGGKPPLGYDVDPETKKLVVNPQEAEAVKLIYQMFADGESHSTIIKTLNALGYKTKKGADFIPTSLYSILTNPKYSGLYVFNRSSAKNALGTRNTHLLKDADEIITVEGGCPAIVEPSLYAKAQKRIDKNKHKGARHNAKEFYLLSGKLRCSECGKNMIAHRHIGGRNKRVYIGYYCSNKQCGNREIDRDRLEHYVVQLLEQEIFNEKAMQRIIQRIEKKEESGEQYQEEQRKRIRMELQEVEASIDRIVDAIATGLSSESLSAKLQGAEDKKTRLQIELLSVGGVVNNEDSIAVDPETIPAQYEVVKLSTKTERYKTFIQSFIDKIDVGKYRIQITLKTGLDRWPELDSTFYVRRQELYEKDR